MGETGTKGGDGNPPRPRPARSRLMSPITRRILAINILALGFLGAGILYLDEYKENLIDAELTALGTQAEMFAVALSEGAVAQTASGHYRVSEISNQMVRRLVQTTSSRARLFGTDGRLIADSDFIKMIATTPAQMPSNANAGNSQNDARMPLSNANAGKSPNQARDMAVPATLEITIGANAFSA